MLYGGLSEEQTDASCEVGGRCASAVVRVRASGAAAAAGDNGPAAGGGDAPSADASVGDSYHTFKWSSCCRLRSGLDYYKS